MTASPTNLKTDRNAAEARSAARPQLSMLPYNALVYQTRGTSYGGDKYARSNFMSPPAGVDAFERFSEYLDAALRHLTKIAHAMTIARAHGTDRAAACAVPDDDGSPHFPPSMLPHLAHALAGLGIAVEIGVMGGLLPADPGEPWKQHPQYDEVLARRGATGAALAQKDDPDAERARISSATPGIGAWERALETNSKRTP